MNKKNKIHILQLIYGFGMGGGEAKLLELVKKLDKKKYAITICSVGPSRRLEDQFRKLGVDIFIFGGRWRYNPALPFKVAKLIRKRNIDIVMTTLFYADIIGSFASRISAPRALISWEVITHPLNRRRRFLYSLASGRIDKVVTVSKSLTEFVIKERHQDPAKITNIYYGVDTEKYKKRRKEGRLREELGDSPGVVFGVVARLREQKGHVYLIDALPRVVEKYPNVKFVFVGRGQKEAELKAQVARLGLQEYVIFLGLRRDVKELLNEFDVFVLPSLWEGFPNVVLEAMSCSLPVIATTVEGTVELVVDGETGFLVPSRDPQALATALLKILDSPELIGKFGAASRKRIEENFTLEKQVAEFEALYDAMAQRA